MTVKQLIACLSRLNQKRQVMILDGFNGSGIPREINAGPSEYTIQPQDANESADCDDMIGEPVYTIGFGSY